MSSSFKIFRSTVAGHVPTALQLADDHLAINEADGILFWLDSNNVVQSLFLLRTPEWVLSQIITVDGSGSGLDSDTLDGLHAAAFSLVGHTHTGYATSATTVTGSGLVTGGGDLSANRVLTVTKATQAEAQAATDDTHAMTPLRVKDAIFALVPGAVQFWVPAIAIVPRVTLGAASGKIELSSSKALVETLDFDPTQQEYAQFTFSIPKSWNHGAIGFSPIWSHAATSTNFGVAWLLQGVIYQDNSNLDVAFGTAAASLDTGGTTNFCYLSPSASMTLAGTPGNVNFARFQVSRNVADAGDTLAIDARLHGINIYLTSNAPNDS